jgi:hypothetical protein
MTKIMFSVLAAGLVLSLGTGAARAQDKATKDNFERKAHALNVAAKKAGTPNALRAISVETGVPLEKVQAMYKNRSEAGPAGILVACVLADETKLAPERFLEGEPDVKSWETLISHHNVPLEKVNERLDHVQRVMTNPDKANRPAKDKSR